MSRSTVDQKSSNIGKNGLKIKRFFTKKGNNRLEDIVYEKRTSKIVDTSGESIFEQNNVEVPASWSQVATDILAQKYFRKRGVPKSILEKERTSKDEGYEDIVKSEGVSEEETGEYSIKQVAHRLAGTWTWWGEQFGYFDTEEDANAFYDEIKYTIISQTTAPNSPQWFNTGLAWAYGITGSAQGHYYVDPATGELLKSTDAYSHPQPSACFIQEVKDDLVNPQGIFDLLTREARVFKFGSGTGSNFSSIREKGAKLAGGGSSSGVMSFLSVFDTAAGSIKSGGTTRRAAKMVILNVDHPDVEDFIEWKVKEERKVVALVAGSQIVKDHLKAIMESAEKDGLNPEDNADLKQKIKAAKEDHVPLNYIKRVLMLVENGTETKDFNFEVFDTDYRSEAYHTVDGQNSNNTVRVTDEYMEAVKSKSDWELKSRVKGGENKVIPATQIWDKITGAAWESADPGLQFDTTINDWHTCLNDGRINASNPCSEYMFLDETACNLASINLGKFYDVNTKTFDVEAFEHVVRIWTMVLEISVLMSQSPSPLMAERTFQYRTLGLGYANLGMLLMRMGLPYDSEEARAITGSVTAIMTGRAYATSAEMAQNVGPFERYDANKEVMQKVIRNHRRAAYDAPVGEYEGLSTPPMGINPTLAPPYMLTAARNAWDDALDLGEEYGYRNAQVSVIAPTGTIGLVMDCDTTGFEPDFALVKYKKLVGGGYFKIANQSIEPALEALGYSNEEVSDILRYVLGSASLDSSPHINRASLKEKGFTDEKVDALNMQLESAFNISFLFNKYVLGEDFVKEIISDDVDIDSPSFSMLEELGFTKSQIEEANEFVCGAMTTEGAPHLKEEHYAVFDCANKCGNSGTRYIAPMGRVKMLAAGQPFISGSISKTVNLPEEATIQDISNIYWSSWELGLKCNALYRDGSKLSQPLSSSNDSDSVYAKLFSFDDDDYTEVSPKEAAKTIEEAAKVEVSTKELSLRRKLPDERISITHKFEIGGHEGYITVGLFEDGNPGEIFLTMSKEGSTLSGIMDAWAVSLSLNLQYGVPLSVLLNKYAHVRFEPSGMTINRNIPMAKSVVDYVARWLALKFLDTEAAKRYHTPELVERAHSNGGLKAHVVSQVYKKKGHKSETQKSGMVEAVSLEVKTREVTVEEDEQKMTKTTDSNMSDMVDFARNQAQKALKQNNEDAPTCSDCGAVMIRNGACYKCLDCGATSGCS